MGLREEIAAQMELERQGSVMARPEKPQWRKDSPLLDALLGGVDKTLGLLDPVNNIGAPGEAIFGPIRTAAQKQVAKAMWRADPDLFKAVASDPRRLKINAPGRSAEAAREMLVNREISPTALGSYDPNADLMNIPPATLRGRVFQPANDPALDKFIKNPYKVDVDLPGIVGHEATHFLNSPRIYPTQHYDVDATQKMYDSLVPYLGSHGVEASSNAGMNTLDSRVALDEALAYLSSPKTRNPAKEAAGSILQELLKVRPNVGGGTRGVRLTQPVLESAIGKAEAMSDRGMGQGSVIYDMLTGKVGGANPAPREMTRFY